MKINSISNDFTLKSGYLEVYKDPHNSKDTSAGLCGKNNKEYNVSFNGGLPIQNGAAVNAIKSKKMKALDWLLKFVKDHNVSGSALMALFLAGVLRPLTIMALPGKKDKEDKIYASGHSIASGLIGFGVSTVLTTPWDNGVMSVMQNYQKHYDTVIKNIKDGTNEEPEPLKYKFDILNKRYEKLVEIAKEQGTKATALEKKLLKKQIDNMGLMMKNITEWAIAVPRSILTIALIPPILKYVFGVEKKKSEPAPVKKHSEEVLNNVENYRKMTGMPSKDFYSSFRFEPKWFNQAKGGNN